MKDSLKYRINKDLIQRFSAIDLPFMRLEAKHRRTIRGEESTKTQSGTEPVQTLYPSLLLLFICISKYLLQ